MLTVLSIPDGFPWINLSPSNAHLFTKSSSLSPNVNQPLLLRSRFTVPDRAIKTADKETQNDADEPKPDPRGSSEVIMTFAGLNLACEVNYILIYGE